MPERDIEHELSLASNMHFLSEEIQIKIKSKIESIERERLSQAEDINNTLYKNVNVTEEFFRKDFPKTGTKTLLLGKDLLGKVILRIIPSCAFIAWMDAYKNTDAWKEAGFDYVPVEPIIRAHIAKDGAYTRVYSAVLGVSVQEYLGMHSNKKYHHDVEIQTDKIKTELKKMGITHGHAHDHNFCILHERTADGKIDWDRPPRVYCIDFDQAVSS